MITAQIGLVRATGFYGRAIQAFQQIENRDDNNRPSQWNHAFMAISETHLLEAAPGGARIRPISDYPEIRWSQFQLSTYEAQHAIAWMLAHNHAPYAYDDIVFIAIAILTGDNTPAWIDRHISNDNRWICSAMVDAAYNYAGIHMFHDREPAAVFPATIARLFDDYGW